MPIKDNREYRSIELRAADTDEYIVEGYATTYDDKYEMWEDEEGNKYFETISRDALKDADMSDVLFLYNHEGRVFARQKNGTLEVKSDDKGIFVRADLSSTKASREMYEDIKAGLVTQMSWAFTVREDSYDRKTRTRSIDKVKKVFDVSAVSIPANPSTSISARDYFNGVIEAERAERLEREAQMKRIRIKAKIGG
jgi:HK97 family phage prohead protease